MDTVQVETRALAWPDQANALRIVDTRTFQAAGVMLVDIRGLREEVNAEFDPTIKAANAAHKTAVGAKKRVETPLAEAEATIKRMMAVYQTECERRRAEAQRKLEEEMRRMEEEKRLISAEKMLDAGLPEVADSLMEAPIVIAPVRVAALPKADGVSFREVWRAEVTNLADLAAYAAANPELAVMLIGPNMTGLNQLARTRKSDMNIPGVKAVSEKTVSARAAGTDELPY